MAGPYFRILVTFIFLYRYNTQQEVKKIYRIITWSLIPHCTWPLIRAALMPVRCVFPVPLFQGRATIVFTFSQTREKNNPSFFFCLQVKYKENYHQIKDKYTTVLKTVDYDRTKNLKNLYSSVSWVLSLFSVFELPFSPLETIRE